MNYSRNPLYQALQYALVPSALAGLALASSTAFAQDSEEEDSAIETVQVTGSRLNRLDIEGANPVTVLDRTDIQRTGISDLGELIQDLPMMSGSPISSQRNNGGSGQVAADIRGLGTNRTLVLINGNRTPALFNDFSLIPVVMVERIEILKDGASAIYGADAVAGVVNIITRRDFQGAEVFAQMGESFDVGGTNYQVNFITGGNSDRGNFVVGVEYSQQDEVYLAEYDQQWLRAAVTVYDPDEFHQYGFGVEPGTDGDGDGWPAWTTAGSSRIPNGYFNIPGVGNGRTICVDSATGGASPSDYGPRDGVCGPATYDFAPVNFMQTPYERTSFFGQADYELFDGVTAYLETRFANRKSEQILASQPYDSRFDPGYQVINPANGAPVNGISKDNYYNPFGVDITQWRRRVIETGGRLFTQDVDQWQIVTGIEGEIGSDWTWDVSYNYGKNNRSDTDYGQFAGGNLSNALGPSFLDPNTGQVVCGTPANPIPGCVSLNAFTNPTTNPITPAMLAYISVPLNDRYINTRSIFDVTFVGNAYELPAGPLGTAVGFERRRERYDYIPDSGKALGIVTGNTGAGTSGSYDVDSFFGEVNVPLLSGVTGAELLEVTFSGRYDDFSIFDSSTTWQAALRWKPVDSLLLRGTWGQVYREPNISELFAGQGDNFPNVTDPCSGAGGTPGCEDVPVTYVQQDPQARTTVGGNINITPEEGDTLTLGLAWTPDFAEGFNMTIDWWKVDIDDAINTPSANVVLNGCWNGSVPAFCENVSRFFDGSLNNVITLVQKVGPESAEGIDWALNYSMESKYGMWDFSWYGTYNIERKQLVLKDLDHDGLATVEIADVVGLFENRGLGRPKSFSEWRYRFDTDWSMGDWGVSLSMEFIDGVTECGSPLAAYLGIWCPDDPQVFNDPSLEERVWINTLDDVYYFDLVGRYTVPGWGTELSAGILNLTDEELPFLNQGFNATTDEDTYRAAGRSWFVSVTHSF